MLHAEVIKACLCVHVCVWEKEYIHEYLIDIFAYIF